jgi:hypothetical protein
MKKGKQSNTDPNVSAPSHHKTKKGKQSNTDPNVSAPSHQNRENPISANRNIARKKKSDWLGIVNMIISVFVGIVLAFYFNFRNGQLETSNLHLQAQLQGQYNSASLEITCPNIDCTQMFKVTNTGFGEAKSVNIVIAIGSVPLPWTQFVDNINQFRLSVHPLSAPVRVYPTIDTSVNALPSNKSNAYLLTLDNLGPQSSITVSIYPDNLYRSIKDVTKIKQPYNATLYYTTSEIQDLNTPNNIEEIINDFIDGNFFGIANFTIDASCNTCTGDTSYASYPSFKASTVNNNFLVTSNSETFLPTGAPQELQNGVYSLAISFTVNYMMPRGFKISIPSPLDIQVNNYGSDKQSILECRAVCSIFSSS